MVLECVVCVPYVMAIVVLKREKKDPKVDIDWTPNGEAWTLVYILTKEWLLLVSNKPIQICLLFGMTVTNLERQDKTHHLPSKLKESS